MGVYIIRKPMHPTCNGSPWHWRAYCEVRGVDTHALAAASAYGHLYDFEELKRLTWNGRIMVIMSSPSGVQVSVERIDNEPEWCVKFFEATVIVSGEGPRNEQHT